MSKKLSFLMCITLAVALAGNCSAELLVHYGFDETSGNRAVDSTGGNDGTVYGGSWQTPGAVVQTTPGHLVITGDDARVEVPGLPSAVGDFTIMSWVKKTNMGRFTWLVGTGVGGANLQVSIEEERQEGYVAVGCGGEWTDTENSDPSGPTSFRSNRWHHLALVRHSTSGELDVFIDGVLERTLRAGPGPIDLSTFMIGNWPRAWDDKPGSYRPLNGGYDDFAIWNEALSGGAIDGSEPKTVNYYRLNGVVLRESVQFDKTDSGGFEGVTSAAVGVTLHNAKPGLTYTVQYSVTGGTAAAGADYNLPAGTLTFNPGETNQTIDIDIISDAAAEPDETMIITLSNPSGGALGVGAKSQHTYTIYNSPPPVLFAADSSHGEETEPEAQVEVILAYPTSQIVTVNYAATGGTATAGADYQLSAGILTFAPGDTSETISFTILDDAANEASEKVVIGLSGASNASVGSPGEHAYRIYDDEPGIPFDGMVWYHSEWPSMLDVDDDGNLRWAPAKYHQVIVRLPEQRLSQVGDVVEVTYLWKSDGTHGNCSCNHRGDGCECFDSDITCLAGTSGDFHLGLFDSNGRGYIEDEYMGNSADIFNGYLGYDYRIYPHVDPGLGRLTDCHGEVHKSGAIEKRTDPDGALFRTLSNYEPIGSDAMGGFGLAPDTYSELTLRLERTGSGRVQVSITLNGITRSATDNDSANQPQKIDVLAMYFHHSSREYSYVHLATPLSPRSSHPNPADGGKDVPMDVTLGWRGGTVADSYDVYFGETLNAVSAATKASPEFKGSKTGPAYTPPRLVMEQSYYWRVDDVTSTEALKGEVWSFTTAPCTRMDGFEGTLSWEAAGGAWIETSTEHKRSGSTSLMLQYYNRSPIKSSGAALAFDDGLNLSSFDAVGFYHKGEAGNMNDKLYATIEDSAGHSSTVLSPSSINLADEQWRLWSVELSEFSGVDLADVKKIEVGVGTPGGSSSSALGNLYVDDFGVCGGGGAVGCACFGDLDGNTQVDLDDLQAVAGILLQAGSPFVVEVEEGHCGDVDENSQIDLDDLQTVAGILLQAGSPFIAPCE